MINLEIMKSFLKRIFYFVLILSLNFTCKKNSVNNPSPSGTFKLVTLNIDDSIYTNTTINNIDKDPNIQLGFSAPLDQASAQSEVIMSQGSNIISLNYSFGNHDSLLIVQPKSPLSSTTSYTLTIFSGLKSQSDSTLKKNIIINLSTSLDTTDKFPRISDSALLDLVEQQTFKYFWDFGHPVSGLARERNSSGDVVTIGGSGFGVMAILAGISRNFISRPQGLNRISQIVSFLTTSAQRYHGAFPHWLNGSTGATIPFSSEDDGADLVETSYLMEGLLCARQYFNSGSDSTEINLRAAINQLWNGIEWSWFRQNGQNVLYWHWSPDFGFAINMQINGWNEAMIVYALAASSNTDTIPKIVYDNGWAGKGNMKNGNSYYGIPLPLGPNLGGPLFFAHYSFLGINPSNLQDAYANYWTQNTNHTQINFSYCVANPKSFVGYSSSCWGLTASDDNNGYLAHAPDNDDGVISPTAAISSLPYTPTRSMDALRFFYYKLGDKIWGQYGFMDAFNLTTIWFSNSWLAIDQGPEIIMIENFRTGLIWNLFMSCPEIKRGMKDLGFQSPNLQ